MNIRLASILLLLSSSAFGSTSIPKHLGIDFRSGAFAPIAGQVFDTTVNGFRFISFEEPPEPEFTWDRHFGIGESGAPILITNPEDVGPGAHVPFPWKPIFEGFIVEFPSTGVASSVTGVWFDDLKASVGINLFYPVGGSVAFPDKNGEAFAPLRARGDTVQFESGGGAFKIAGFTTSSLPAVASASAAHGVPDKGPPLGLSILALGALLVYSRLCTGPKPF